MLKRCFLYFMPDFGVSNRLEFIECQLDLIISIQETIMADFTKLNENIAALAAAVDAKLNAPAPADDQPAIDSAAQAVADITAKLVPAA